MFDQFGQLQAIISSQQGVKQGDPFSSFLFAHTIQAILTEALGADALSHVSIVAYLDDILIVGDPDEVLTVYNRLRQALPRIGLEVNPDKSSCLWPSATSPMPIHLRQQFHNLNITVHTGMMEDLGGPIGFDREAIRDWCQAQVSQHDEYFSLLSHHCMPSHHALLLLKSSLRPKLNFLLRVIPPSLFSTALDTFENKIQNLIRTKIIPSAAFDRISPFTSQHMALPYKNGGLGLTSSLIISHAAFIASCATAVPNIAPLLRPDHLSGNNILPTFHDIVNSSSHLTNAVVDLELPSTPQEIVDFYSDGNIEKHLQSQLMTSYQEFCLDSLLDSPDASNENLAYLIASQAPNSSSWLHLNHNTPNILSDEAFEAALIHRLNLPLSSLPPNASCRCGKPLDVTHLFCCAKNKRNGLLKRHDAIKFKLAAVARAAGLDVEIEPNHWLDEDDQPEEGRRPDLTILGLGRPIFVDVSVACPAAPTHRRRVVSSGSTTHLLREREKRKLDHYESLTLNNGAQFFPFTLTSSGSFGEKAIKLLQILARATADLNSSISFKDAFNSMLSAISISLQHGTLSVIQKGISRCL